MSSTLACLELERNPLTLQLVRPKTFGDAVGQAFVAVRTVLLQLAHAELEAANLFWDVAGMIGALVASADEMPCAL